jgi:hypothetical protein
MGASRQQAQASGGLIGDLAFGQNAPPDADDRIGGDGEATTELRTFCGHRRRDRGLLRGEPLYESARRFAPARRLVDIGRDHRVGVDAHLRKQGEAPG